MNLNQLRYVVAVSEHASFSSAAGVCFVTQPSLSNGISALEDELGGKLFDRSTRQVKLSTFGVHMMPLIKRVVDGEKNLKLEAQQFLKIDNQTVRLGISPLVSSHLSAALMNAFAGVFPEHELLLIEDNLGDLSAALNTGLVDVILVPDTGVDYDGTVKTFIDSESLYFIEKEGISRQSVTIESINQKTFLMVPDACGLSTITRKLFGDTIITEYEGRAMSYQVLEGWALSGLGVAILPESKTSASDHRCLLLAQELSPLKIDFCIYWNKLPIPKFQNFLQIVINQLNAESK